MGEMLLKSLYGIIGCGVWKYDYLFCSKLQQGIFGIMFWATIDGLYIYIYTQMSGV